MPVATLRTLSNGMGSWAAAQAYNAVCTHHEVCPVTLRAHPCHGDVKSRVIPDSLHDSEVQP